VAALRFNPPPGWDVPGDGWSPPHGWTPDPAWPTAPDGWQFWVRDTAPAASAPGQQQDGSAAGDDQADDRTADDDDAEEEVEVAVAEEEEQDQADGPDEVVRLRAQVAELEAELAARATSGSEAGGVIELSDERILQDVGIYRYHHPLENAAAYKDRLASKPRWTR